MGHTNRQSHRPYAKEGPSVPWPQSCVFAVTFTSPAAGDAKERQLQLEPWLSHETLHTPQRAPKPR